MNNKKRSLIITPTITLLVLLSSSGYAKASTEDEIDIERIVVTATRSEKLLLEVPAAITLQNFEDLRKKGFTYGTDEFRGVPGVFFRRGEGDGEEFPFISIRGATGNHGNDTFLALVDGIPFVGPDEEVLLTEVPYPVVDQVEIVRGPVSALYGRGAIGGAVNYKTRVPTSNSTELSLSLGENDFYQGSGLIERKFDNDVAILASVSYEDFEGWRDNSARESSSAFLKAIIPVDETSTLSAWFTFFNRDAEVPSAIPTLSDGTPVEVFGGEESFLGKNPSDNSNSGWISALRYETDISNNASIQLTAQVRSFDKDINLNFYDYYEFDPENNIMGVNGFKSNDQADVYFTEAVFNWQKGRHNIVAGLSAEKTTLDEKNYWSGENDPFFSGECGFKFYAILIDYSTGEVVNDSPDNSCFVREQLRTAAKTTNTFYGSFIQDEIALTDDLTFTIGGRFDSFKRDIDFSVVGTEAVEQNAQGDESAFSPKASLAYDYGNGIFYTSYGRGFNSNFGPIFQWEPTQYARDEKATTIDSYELGWKGKTDNSFLTWEMAIFYLQQNDRRIFISNPDPMGPPTLATTGQEYSSKGFEGSLLFKPTNKSNILINYTYLDPEWDELIIAGSYGGEDRDYSGNIPQGVPENMVYVEASYDFSQSLSTSASLEWYGDYYVDLSNSVKTGQYELVNLSATYTPQNLAGYSFDFSVTNLLNEDYLFYFAGSETAATNASPGVPRQFRLTMRAKF